MDKGIPLARLLLLLAVLLTAILGTSVRAQDAHFPFASGGGWAVDGLGYVHFAFSAEPDTGSGSPKGHGRFDFPSGASDSGDVVCFSFTAGTQNVARFIIKVTKGTDGVGSLLLVEVIDTGSGEGGYLGYRRNTTNNCLNPDTTNPQPLFKGNIVVSDGQ
jgi:hypothetical protein